MRIWLTFAALIFLAIMFSGCASVPEKYWQVNRMTSDRFTYVTDYEKHGVADFREEGVTGDAPFSSDCEEYGMAVQHQLAKMGVKSTIWIVKRKYDYHALTCTSDGWCMDAFNVPVRRENVPDTFISRM